MGLTSTSTGNNILNEDFSKIRELSDYSIALRWKPKCREIHYI